MREEGFKIAKGAKLLHGHVSPETAFVVDDYPYGRELRCQRRSWVETACSGQKKGEQRAVHQTTNPRVVAKEINGAVWNKPHPEQYYTMVLLILEKGNDHLHSVGISLHTHPEEHAFFTASGLQAQLAEDELKRYRTIRVASCRFSPGTWLEWAGICRVFAERMDAGHSPSSIAVVRDMLGKTFEYPHPTLGKMDATLHQSTANALAALWDYDPQYVHEFAKLGTERS